MRRIEADRMKHDGPVNERRRVLNLGSLVIASIAMVPGSAAVFAQAPPPRVEESDEQAQTLGYRHDAAEVDKTRFPEHRPGQMCSNCKVYLGKPGEPWGPCPIFHGKQVSAKGWCHSYVPKA